MYCICQVYLALAAIFSYIDFKGYLIVNVHSMIKFFHSICLVAHDLFY